MTGASISFQLWDVSAGFSIDLVAGPIGIKMSKFKAEVSFFSFLLE